MDLDILTIGGQSFNPNENKLNNFQVPREINESFIEIHRRNGHLIEKIITDILNKKDNGNIIPEDLPYLIDQEIKNKIESQ